MKNTELKIYKRLAEIRGNLLRNILEKVNISNNNHRSQPDKQRDLIGKIAKPSEWAKNGFITAEEKSELELLKFLTDGENNQCEIKRYRNHIEDYDYHRSNNKQV